MKQPNRVNDIRTRCSTDLPTAGFGIARCKLDIHLLDEVKDGLSNRLSDRVLFFLHSVGSRNATARLLGFLHRHTGDQAHELNGGHTQSLRLELAGCVVRNGDIDALHIHVELPAIVKIDKELADIPGT